MEVRVSILFRDGRVDSYSVEMPENMFRSDPLTTACDPGCAKTPQAQKRGEWISQINQD
jgi:hypothetical protein